MVSATPSHGGDPEKTMPAEFNFFKVFVESLMSTYGNSNLKDSLGWAIKAPIQMTSIAQYKMKFQCLHQYIMWNEPALLDCFYPGFKEIMKD